MVTARENELITLTGPGTPGGALMRRYWHPIALDSDLPAGGDLQSDQTGYFDDSDPDFVVRWRITNNSAPSHSKRITVAAVARRASVGPQRQVELTVVRGR